MIGAALKALNNRVQKQATRDLSETARARSPMLVFRGAIAPGGSMSRDPDNYYDEEYWEEVGRQEEIAAAIQSLSEQPIREFLGTYGDAIDARLEDTLAMARYASQGGFPRYAVVGAVTAIELITRYMLVQPLMQGAFLSDSWAKLLAKHITQGRMAQERDLLSSVLGMYGIRIDDLKLAHGSALWKTFVTTIVPKRNAIMHDGDNATPEEAKLALECANTLRKEVVAHVAKKMGFDLEKNGAWNKHLNAEGFYHTPASPFE
jgi:hypothetical protein